MDLFIFRHSSFEHESSTAVSCNNRFFPLHQRVIRVTIKDETSRFYHVIGNEIDSVDSVPGNVLFDVQVSSLYLVEV